METVSHHGRTIAYRESDRGGGGSPVLFVHGSGGSSGVWRSQFRLADERPVVALDLSGHGESDDFQAEPGYETLCAYVDDVVTVAEETDARAVVGNSLGGAVAMLGVLERDFEPDELVLAGTGAKLAVLDDLLAWLDDDFDRAVDFLHEPDRLFHDPDERYVTVSKNAMYETGQTVTRRDFRSVHEFDERDRLDEITPRSLALVGEHDQLTPPHYHEYLAEHVPDCELAVVEDAAHLSMLERPEAFNAALAAFLD
ncbi:MAG: alpha/beta fold hydrolase [Haloferacaceae archaeon]